MLIEIRNLITTIFSTNYYIFYVTKLGKLYFSVHSSAKLLNFNIYNLNFNPNSNKPTLFLNHKRIEICSIENHWELNIYVILLCKMSALYNKL